MEETKKQTTDSRDADIIVILEKMIGVITKSEVKLTDMLMKKNDLERYEWMQGQVTKLMEKKEIADFDPKVLDTIVSQLVIKADPSATTSAVTFSAILETIKNACE